MICRACLRARSAPTSETFLSQRLLQTAQKQSISTFTARLRPSMTASARVSCSQLSKRLSRHQLFSTSSSISSVAAQPRESAPAPSGTPEKPNYLSEGESQIWDILVAEFAPTQLVVQDISGGCGSMYGIEICSEKFRGLNMLKQQRLVNAALGGLMKEWHGVQLKTRVP
ncbi:bola protein [Thermothelomyces heterothallicus CBS 202.75]|uniref:bola protein n=1 Tax=Thermothelomyces heterothallicus CBS 202.75 TaxID=1149848 RepID=UPI003743C088